MHAVGEHWLGSATISPDGPVVAGSLGTWTIRYTVGVSGIAGGGGTSDVPGTRSGRRSGLAGGAVGGRPDRGHRRQVDVRGRGT